MNLYVASLIDPSWEGFRWVLAVALTVLALDIFFATEVLSWIALAGISTYLSLLVEVDAKWRVLLGLCVWVATMAIFYKFGRNITKSINIRLFGASEDEVVSANETRLNAVGDRGRFRVIEGIQFVEWNGDLWRACISDESEIEDKEWVLIAEDKNDLLHVSRIH